ncbi:MAG: sugar phosphate isomerase/epimerase family protein [Armatimonadota bacterium]
MDRRKFLKCIIGSTVATPAIASQLLSGSEAKKNTPQTNLGQFKKAIILDMLPENPDLEKRFVLAKELGFHGLEVKPVDNLYSARKMRQIARNVGIELHSVIYGGWHAPLSSPDSEVVRKGMDGAKKALECATELGADGVLLVPAIVNEQVRYVEAYERSQKYLKELAQIAEKLQVMILIENVWNNFLLSPLEFARYIDEINSPWVQAYFDVGNVVAFGWPEDWIRTLGKRIKKVHLKDFKKGPRQFVNLRDGDVNWKEVRKALKEVGYRGYLTAELRGGDEEYLRDLSSRMDTIIKDSNQQTDSAYESLHIG